MVTGWTRGSLLLVVFLVFLLKQKLYDIKKGDDLS
jgi:hypothetical protein